VISLSPAGLLLTTLSSPAILYLCGSIMVRRRARFIVAFFIIVAALILLGSRFAISNHPHLTHLGPSNPQSLGCIQHLGWLEPYQFSSPIEYVSRDIIARPLESTQRLPLTVVDEPLFESSTWFNLAESPTLHIEHCLPPLQLKVSHGSMVRVDASNMIFGLQTTIERLRDTVKYLARWLPYTGARLYAIVIDTHDDKEIPADNNEMQALEEQMRDLGMNVHVIRPSDPTDSFAQRYFSIVNVLYKSRDNKSQWMICIDDDTFFPSMNDLQNMLREHDWQKPQYIGGLSEDWWAVDHYGLMGFGGAGVMLSRPMAKIIYDHYDECKRRPRTTAGDVTVMDCIYRFSSTKLTPIPGMHQVDLHGDVSGFYESGREMLSLHHWKGGKLKMEKMHMIADICDNCFLQRWQFQHGLILSNGFSIASYPQRQLTLGGLSSIADSLDFGLMEQTWSDDIKVLHSLAPLRPKLDEYQKVSYKLLDSMILDGEEVDAPGEKVVRQVYFKEGGQGEGRDTVIVLNWRSSSEINHNGEDVQVHPLI
jgi:hypothetical protein